MKKINLSVKRGLFRSDDPTADEANSEFKKVRKDILKRDDNTCQYCGFRSDKYQEVHHIDDNHSNNEADNLITICAICHSCFHIGLSGIRQSGILIQIPPAMKVTQAQLNQLTRALWIGEVGGSKEVALSSISVLSRLKKRTVEARRTVGTSDPTILGDFLLNLEKERYNNRSDSLKGIYLLPLKEGFEKQLSYWASNSFKAIPPSTWHDISKQKVDRWAKNKLGDSGENSLKLMLGITE